MKKIFTLFVLLVSMNLFAKTNATINLIISNRQTGCYDSQGRVSICLQVREFDKNTWTSTSSIEGFSYEPGYEYILEVIKKDISPVPADAISFKYVLVKVISKIKVKPSFVPILVYPTLVTSQTSVLTSKFGKAMLGEWIISNSTGTVLQKGHSQTQKDLW